jgi:DNA-binding NarL/FixJ family response regulator
MSTDSLAALVLVETRDIRSIKQQIVDAMARISRGVSAEGLGQALMKLLETTEHHIEHLERIFRDAQIALERKTPSTSGTLPPTYYRLTSREAEVLQLIAEGYANKQIAAELAISIKTVEKHRQRMMAKLDLHDTAGVTRYAMSAGLVGVSV